MTETTDRIEQISREAADAIAAAQTTAALEEVRIRYLGRKAELPNLLRGVAQLAPEQRAATGKAANAANRLGFFFTTSATKSFDSRATAICSATSACSTPGEFSESTCMSMPAASISAIRPLPTS